MKLRTLIIVLCALLSGGALGFTLHGEPPASGSDELLRAVQAQREELRALREALAEPRSTRVAAACPPSNAAAQNGELLRAVQEAIASARTSAAAPAPQVEPEPPSAESVAASEEVRRLLQQATSARRWTDQDVQEMRRLMSKVSGAERYELQRQLVVAINSRALVVETHGPPF